MTALRASRILFSTRCPATERIIFLSAVNILLGRIKLSTGRLPEIKSCVPKGSARGSDLDLLVIWQTIISSPIKSATTNAGRFLLPDKSVNGKGIITTSPFTNLPMPHPLPAYPSLLTGQFHSIAWLPEGNLGPFGPRQEIQVFAKVFGVLSMQQNLQLHQYIVPEASLFHVIKQRDLSLYFSPRDKYSMKRRKEQAAMSKEQRAGSKVKIVVSYFAICSLLFAI